MATTTPRALFIGHPTVGEALRKKRPEWQWEGDIPTIEDFWTGMDNGTINNDTQIVFIIDTLFDKSNKDSSFEDLIATLGPFCFLGIISYKPQLKGQIRERIDNKANSLSVDTFPYYFIDPNHHSRDIDEALARFVKIDPNSQVTRIILGEDVDAPAIEASPAPPPQEAPAPHVSSFQENFGDGKSDYLGQIIAVTSSKGGSGKSTIAVGTATYLAHASANSVREGLADRPLKVAIVDFDIRDGQLGFLTGNVQPNIFNLLNSGITPETIKATAIHSERLKCDLFLAPKKPRTSDNTPTEFYIDLLQSLRMMYDYIILDTSVNYLDVLLEKVCYPMADNIIFVTDIVITSVLSMTRWIHEVTRDKEKQGMGINRNKIGIVINKAQSDVEMQGEKIAQAALGLRVLTVVPSSPRFIAHATNIQSMEALLLNEDLKRSLGRIAQLVVGKRYPLSGNVAP